MNTVEFSMTLLAAIFLLFAIINSSNGYPTGAPPTACSTLTPVHKNNFPQTSLAPYDVTINKMGNKIRVTISGVDTDFQGFMMQARYARNPNRLAEGTFTTQQGLSQAIDCQGGKQNTITQVNRNPKSNLVTDWTPAAGVNDEVIFRVTVAKTFQEFWTNIDSPQIRVSSSGGGNNQKQTELSSKKMYDDCFVNKGCFGYPADCVTRRDCEIFLSYVNTGDGVSFTMIGSLGSSQNYMATGLSTDRRMGDDSVTECFMENGRVMAQNSWNKGTDNTPLTVIPEGMYEWQFENGVARCTWTRPYVTIINQDTSDEKLFNMSNSTYYVLIAKGPTSAGRVRYHNGRLSSQESVNFTSYDLISGEGAHDAVKVHGSFMVTGWVAFVSLGILMARHFKNDWDDQKLCGVKIWFAVHRGLMIAALVFIIIAFIVIFVHIGGWNYKTNNTHAVLGCIATALGLFQPIMAAFRPSPDNEKRVIFNWLHWAVGNVAQLIAVITIFFAPSLEGSGLKESFYWVMGVFVVIHCLFHVIFQLQIWKADKKKNNEIKMQNMTSGRVVSPPNGVQGKSLEGGVVRGLLLGVYVIFITVIMLALYALIGTA